MSQDKDNLPQRLKVFIRQPSGKIAAVIIAITFIGNIIFCSSLTSTQTPAKSDSLDPTHQFETAIATLSTIIPTETAAPLPTQTLAPTLVPPPTSTLTPQDELKSRTIEILSDQPERLTAFEWVESDKFLYIEFAVSDNFTSSMIVTGIQGDIADMLRLVSQSGLLPDYQFVTISGKFPLVDKFGNTSNDIVITTAYNRSTIDKINWDNFLYTNILDIADEIYIHPTLQTLMMEANN